MSWPEQGTFTDILDNIAGFPWECSKNLNKKMCKTYIEKFDENAASKAMNNKYVLFSSFNIQSNW